eukprot:875174-Pyramimonas_sp.AAC.1
MDVRAMPSCDVPTYSSLDHQTQVRAPRESTDIGGFSRVGSWEAILARHCLDTLLDARDCFWEVVTKYDGSCIRQAHIGA